MPSEEITIFLVWQKFPSHYCHFSLIFHHFVQVLVLTGLFLDPSSSAEVGSSWERGVKPATESMVAHTPLGPRGRRIPEKTSSGSLEMGARETLKRPAGASAPLEYHRGTSWL